jgi:hypothetical protein
MFYLWHAVCWLHTKSHQFTTSLIIKRILLHLWVTVTHWQLNHLTNPQQLQHKVCFLLLILYYWPVRGHLSVSLPPLSPPTLPLFICIFPTPLYHLQGPHPKLTTFVFKVQWLSRCRLTNSCQLPTPSSACTSTALDKPRMHWDTSTWHYSYKGNPNSLREQLSLKTNQGESKADLLLFSA